MNNNIPIIPGKLYHFHNSMQNIKLPISIFPNLPQYNNIPELKQSSLPQYKLNINNNSSPYNINDYSIYHGNIILTLSTLLSPNPLSSNHYVKILTNNSIIVFLCINNHNKLIPVYNT